MGGNKKFPRNLSVCRAEETERHHSEAGKISPLAMVLVVAASLAVLTVILIAFVLRSTTASAMKNDNDGDDTAGSRGFCCIDDAAQVASALNTSGDLCEDFYGYVCSRREDPDSNYMSPVFRMFMKWRLMRMLRLSTRQSDAGALMATLRSGMIAKRAAREVVAAAVLNMTAAIATWAKAVLSTTDPATIIRFFAEASLRYGLTSGVAFVPTSPASEDSPPELSLLRNADCDTILASRNLRAATVVNAFGEIRNTTVEAEQVVVFSKALSKLRSREDKENLVQSLKDSPFSVLPNRVWNEIVSEFVSAAYPNMSPVRQAKGDRLNDVLGALANAANRQVTAAFIVVCTSMNAYEEMRAVMDNDRTGVFLPSCDELGLCELEEVFKAEVISTQKADGYIRDYFSDVVDDVAARALDSSRSEPSNGSEENDHGWLKTISLSLGFASVIDPECQEGWSNTHTVGKVTMTEGQLCYLMWVYNHCDSFLRFVPEQDINRAIRRRNSPTFVKTFGCRDDTISGPKTTCPNL
ncbi:hypothetical protein MRX96_019334 [Rhipicephalus microplus]